jgi:WXXGXW repeat (2 copies)
MTSKVLCTLLAAGLCAGCVVDEYGRVLPPDPIGQAIFNALDPAVPVYQPRQYVVESDIPAVRYEQRMVAPVAYADPVWINGYWGWGGNDWVWVPGRWVQRPRQDVVWSDGRYYTSNGRRYWRSGYWEEL